MRRFTLTAMGLLLLAGMVGSRVRAEDAKPLFDKTCASCHGAAGKGDGPAAKAMKTKPQDFATGLKGKSDADITAIIKDGVVNGKPGHPKQAKLSDDQVKSLIEYVKQLGK